MHKYGLQSWQVAQIEEGIRELDLGEGEPHERVAAWMRTWAESDEPYLSE